MSHLTNVTHLVNGRTTSKAWPPAAWVRLKLPLSVTCLIVWVQAIGCTSAVIKNPSAAQSWANFTIVMTPIQRSAGSKGKTLEVSFCTRRTHRPKKRRVNFRKRRQQIHSSHNQGLLKWPPDNTVSLMDCYTGAHLIMNRVRQKKGW